MIAVVELGTIDYAYGLKVQQRLVEMRQRNQIADVLLLLEHTPVITLGRNAKAAHVLASKHELAERGVELFECDRGGDVTFHGAGQLVGYPIFDLRGFPSPRATRHHLGAVEFVRLLEEVLIQTCAEFGVPGERALGLTGVWTRRADPQGEAGQDKGPTKLASETCRLRPQGKLAAIGVHISRSVTSHGFALNVNTELDYFNLIVACGIASKPVTSLERELGRRLELRAVASTIADKFGLVFESQVTWLETLEALVGNTLDIPMKPPPPLRKLHGEEESYWA